jgi:FMN-dependent NADH-azoreductase
MNKKILIFKASPRRNGNSSILAKIFAEEAEKHTKNIEFIDVYEQNVGYCRGCLKCNILKKCSVNDYWQDLSKKIYDADVIVFASPVYFHHLPAPLKAIIDRFRSFVHIQMTESGLVHTPWQKWNKDFVLLLSMGTIEDVDAQPIVDLFEFIVDILGNENKLHIIKAKRVAFEKQIIRNQRQLQILYEKVDLPQNIVSEDFENNQKIIQKTRELSAEICR